MNNEDIKCDYNADIQLQQGHKSPIQKFEIATEDYGSGKGQS